MSLRQRFRLTGSQKAVILDRRDNGLKSTKIAHGTNIPKSTITSFLARVKKHDSDSNLTLDDHGKHPFAAADIN
jgi:hypothetical protein